MDQEEGIIFLTIGIQGQASWYLGLGTHVQVLGFRYSGSGFTRILAAITQLRAIASCEFFFVFL